LSPRWGLRPTAATAWRGAVAVPGPVRPRSKTAAGQGHRRPQARVTHLHLGMASNGNGCPGCPRRTSRCRASPCRCHRARPPAGHVRAAACRTPSGCDGARGALPRAALAALVCPGLACREPFGLQSPPAALRNGSTACDDGGATSWRVFDDSSEATREHRSPATITSIRLLPDCHVQSPPHRRCTAGQPRANERSECRPGLRKMTKPCAR
jgi:hypothetical protein